jgi:hypothetical protein
VPGHLKSIFMFKIIDIELKNNEYTDSDLVYY